MPPLLAWESSRAFAARPAFGELLAVPHDDFLEAVTGHPRSLGAARSIIDNLMGD